MIEFLKKLLGRTVTEVPVSANLRPSSVGPGSTEAVANRTTVTRSRPVGEAAIDRYFELSTAIEKAKADGDYASAITAALETYPLFPAVVRQMKKESGSFDIQVSHAVHSASTLMAVVGDREGIRALRNALEETSVLRDWLPTAEAAEADLILVEAIMAAVIAGPGLRQNTLKQHVSGDPRRLGTLAAWLEKGKRVKRIKQGSTYLLYPVAFPLDPLITGTAPDGGSAASSAPKGAPVPWRVRSRLADRARPLSLESIPYIRLPKAPMVWEERNQTPPQGSEGFTAGIPPEAETARVPHFTVTGEGWSLSSQQTLAPTDRPDPAYKRMYQTAGSTLWIDPKGGRVGFPQAPAVAMTTDRAGAKLAERGLEHGVYRADVNADGSGMLFLSTGGILHGHTENLEPLLTQSVADLPEYAAQAERFGVESAQLKNHVRCVALSTDCSRILVTVVDEAWCYDIATGRPLWGLRFPSKEGWGEVASERSQLFGPSADINHALRLMGLTLPVSPQALHDQYLALAMKWHPDRNPQDLKSTRKFQDLSAAMELLTGVDLSRISASEIGGSTYEQALKASSVNMPDGSVVTISMTMQIGGSFGADWIYAANFSQKGNATFVAGYSGRVVEIDSSGLPRCVYDIGAVPREVADTSSHRYILTDTRLYVLCRDQLVGLVDVFDKGKLIVGDNGFGLLQSKQFQWFTPTGRSLGEVHTRDPIRRIHSSSTGLVVETRRHRGVVRGAQSWW